MAERELFSFNEVSQRWGVSPFTVRRRVEAGEIISVNIGARRLIPLREILRVERDGVGRAKRSRAEAGNASVADQKPASDRSPDQQPG